MGNARRRKRVLHISFAFGDENTGITEAIRGIRKLATDFEHEMFSTYCGVDIPRELVGEAQLRRGYGRRFRFSMALAQAVAECSVDLVHLHGIWTFASVVASAKAMASRVPLVVSPHGMVDPWALRKSWAIKTVAAGFYENSTIITADCFHAVSQREADEIKRLGVGQPVHLIPNAVNYAEVSRVWIERGHRSCASAERRIVLLFLGRVDYKKGIVELIDALNLLPSEMQQKVVLRIVGPWTAGLRDRIEMSLSPLIAAGVVDVVGPIFDSRKWELIRDSDLFVLPSHSEGMPIAAVEALGAGVPAMVTPACGLSEFVQSGGAIECLPDAFSIRQCIVAMANISDGERCRMGQAARAQFDRRLRPELISRAWNRLYSNVIAEKTHVVL